VPSAHPTGREIALALPGTAHVVHVDADDLAVAPETLRAAAPRLRTSPLYPLVRNHLDDLAADARDLPPAAAAALEATTVHLVRALVLSAAGAPPAPTGGRAATAARIRAYVAAHLRDPDLTPARIAAANAVSTRTLHTIYAELGTSPRRAVLEQRLDGARADLASPGRRHHSIAAIARSWGFADPATFSRRFRRAFGLTPRRYRAQQRAARG